MPLRGSDSRIEKGMEKRYGRKRGKSIYYATLNQRINEGRPINTAESRRLKEKRKHHRKHKRRT
jgi:hypothetical protein